MEKATFAAGCFWGVEEAFRKIKGVITTRVGYTGGHMKSPTYQDVCRDRTGHAEAIEIEFDPKIVSYEDLLSVFWRIHNPTTPDRQGFDVGSQYRSVIFFHDEAQKEAAEKSMEAFQQDKKLLGKKIVTEILPAKEFYAAEDYHQQYVEKKGRSNCLIRF